MTYYPIRGDVKHVFASSNNLVHYYITDLHDNLLFEGSAVRKPGEAKAFIYLNRIIASNINIKDLVGPSLGWVNSDATFTVVTKEMGPEATIIRREYTFIYNYDYDKVALEGPINMPAVKSLSQNDLIPISVFVDYGVPDMTATYHFEDGTSTDVTINTSSCVKKDINTICIQSSIFSSPLKRSKSVTINDITYTTDSCSRYSLYYRNKLGGMDILPLNGGLSKSEDFDRTIFTLDYDNSVKSSIGKKVLNNNIETKYTYTSKFMTDEESAIFAKHFISSPDVLLYDNVDDETYSVILDEDSVEYKTFKSNGRKFNQYTFSFSLTHTKKVR